MSEEKKEDAVETAEEEAAASAEAAPESPEASANAQTPDATDVAKRRENSGLPRVWIADLVCARHSLDRDLSRNSRNKMRAHITCRMGRYRSAPLVTKG